MTELHKHKLLLGDFNAHNPLWGSISTNYAGRRVANYLADADMVEIRRMLMTVRETPQALTSV